MVKRERVKGHGIDYISLVRKGYWGKVKKSTREFGYHNSLQCLFHSLTFLFSVYIAFVDNFPVMHIFKKIAHSAIFEKINSKSS